MLSYQLWGRVWVSKKMFFLVCFVVVVVVVGVIVFELKMFGPEVCVLLGLREDFA